MNDNYIIKLDKAIQSLLERKKAMEINPDAFKTDISQITDVRRADKTRERQVFTLESITGRLSGLIDAKALYFKTIKQ